MDLKRLRIDRKRDAAPARRRPAWWAPVAGGLILLAALWLFAGPVRRAVDRVRLPTVQVAEVAEAHPATAGAVRGAAANGHVVAARRAALSTDLTGRLVELNVSEGSFVRKGDVVARLYAEDSVAALDAASARLASSVAAVARATAGREAARAAESAAARSLQAAGARLDEARAASELSRSDLARTRELVGDGVLAARELDAATSAAAQAEARSAGAVAERRAAQAAVADARARAAVADADIELARADQGAAEADRELAAALLQKTEVRAPFDGVVVLKDAEIGEVVSPASTAGSNARGSVCTLVDLDSLEVQADVPETSLSAVRLDGAVSIFLDAHPEREYAGRVTRIWPTANRQKATIEVRAAFDEPDELLRPEMGLRLVFLPPGEEARRPGTDGGRALLVPDSALVRADGRVGVLVLERGRVQWRAITTGERRGGRVTISSGLEVGERVVLEPPPDLEDGDRVLVGGA